MAGPAGPRRRWRAGVVLGSVLTLATAGVLASPTGSSATAGPTTAGDAAVATFSAPPDTGSVIEPLNVAIEGLPAGYVEHEFFAAGTASAYEATSTPADGRWTVTPTTTAPYQTRVIVRRPKTPAAFNGTVVLEWTNQSSGESIPDWAYLNPELGRAGVAYVAVTAQALAVNGGTSLLGSPVTGLRDVNPDRYGSLDHPGDQYAYDIVDQVGRALRDGTQADVLGGLDPKRVVVVGESQSAFFLTTYANTLQARNGTFDGIFVHSRSGSAASLEGLPLPGGSDASAVRVRSDLDAPVFILETETDLLMLGYAAARQPNTSRLRTWEVAGTSHADSWIVGKFAGILGCDSINDGPQHLVAQAAFASFLTWVRGGPAPSTPARLKIKPGATPRFGLDRFGNVRGGVRTPAVVAPTSVLSGIGPADASTTCRLFGSSKHFSAHRLVRVHGTKAAFLSAVRASLKRAVGGGYVLRADRRGILRDARTVASWVPQWN